MADETPGGPPEFIPPPPRRTEPLRAERTEPVPVVMPPATPAGPAAADPAGTETATVKRGFLDYIGPRAGRRPEPRLGIAVAAAGSAMLVTGALAIGGDNLVSSGSGDGSQYPGLFLTLAVVAVGVVLVARFRTGPIAAAGVAASAIALPPFVFFTTFSKGQSPPFDTILLLSTAGWIAAYLLGPGRGHTFYLGAALVGGWLWFIEVTEHLLSFPSLFLFGLANASSGGAFSGTSTSFGSSNFGAGSPPDPATVGGYTLFFAAVYLVVGRLLDKRDRRGLGTPFAFTGIITLYVGISLLSDQLEQVGTGIAYALAGLLLCYFGATESRRAMNWIGAIFVFLGITVVVADPFDSASSFGAAEIVAGAVVILLAHWIVTQFHEPAETDPVLSRFYKAGSVQPSGPPPPPAGSVLG